MSLCWKVTKIHMNLLKQSSDCALWGSVINWVQFSFKYTFKASQGLFLLNNLDLNLFPQSSSWEIFPQFAGEDFRGKLPSLAESIPAPLFRLLHGLLNVRNTVTMENCQQFYVSEALRFHISPQVEDFRRSKVIYPASQYCNSVSVRAKNTANCRSILMCSLQKIYRD